MRILSKVISTLGYLAIVCVIGIIMYIAIVLLFVDNPLGFC